MVTDRANNTDDAFGIGPAKMARRAVGVSGSNLLQWGQVVEISKNLIGANEVLVKPAAIVVKSHELYKTNVIRSLKGQFGQIQDFVVIDSPHHHHIDLYRIETNVFGRLDPAPDPMKLIPAGDAQKLFRLKGVKTDIDAANTSIVDVLGKLFQHDSVGGEAEALQAGECCHASTEVRHPFSYQWLAPRESNLGYSHVHCYLYEVEEFFI